MLSSVDFPDPDDPMMATNSPFLIFKSIPLRTCNELSPNFIGFVKIFDVDHGNDFSVAKFTTYICDNARKRILIAKKILFFFGA